MLACARQVELGGLIFACKEYSQMFEQLARVSYLNPKLEERAVPEKGGFGVFARQAVPAGEVLLLWHGVVLPLEVMQSLPNVFQYRCVQVEEGLYLVPVRANEPSDSVNHSCNPNAGVRGQMVLVALRDIAPEEEVCFDYAMTDGNAYDEFDCQCGAPNCRGRVTGDDWKLPELQQRYAGYFSLYLQRRIDRLHAG